MEAFLYSNNKNIFPDFFGGRLKLTNWTRFSVSRLVNGKNVFFAEYSGKRVVLKKLAHNFGKFLHFKTGVNLITDVG